MAQYIHYRTVKAWNELPKIITLAKNINMFKMKSDEQWKDIWTIYHMVWWFMMFKQGFHWINLLVIFKQLEIFANIFQKIVIYKSGGGRFDSKL